jgi:hypothetical protein
MKKVLIIFMCTGLLGCATASGPTKSNVKRTLVETMTYSYQDQLLGIEKLHTTRSL